MAIQATVRRYRVLVRVVGEETFIANGLTFPSWVEAEIYGSSLAMSWNAVRDWKVEEVKE